MKHTKISVYVRQTERQIMRAYPLNWSEIARAAWRKAMAEHDDAKAKAMAARADMVREYGPEVK